VKNEEKLTLKDVPEEEEVEAAKTEVEDWVDYLGPKAMQLFNQDGDVLVLEDEGATEEALSTMITSADGITSSWVFDDPNSIVPNVELFVVYPFYLINEMNFDFAYFDVTFGIENLTANNSLDNEHDFNKKDGNKIEPVENETILINLGTFENPKEIRISSSLSQEEKQDLMELLKEFQEVFAWSYEDMLGIDPDIAQHRIPTLPKIKPVK
jgi:hypothetical protein